MYENPWTITFLFAHLLAAYGFGKLYTDAPCFMQRLVILGWALAMLIMAGGFALKLRGVDGYLYLIGMAFAIGHLATLFYAWRLVYKEFLCLPSGLRRSPGS